MSSDSKKELAVTGGPCSWTNIAGYLFNSTRSLVEANTTHSHMFVTWFPGDRGTCAGTSGVRHPLRVILHGVEKDLDLSAMDGVSLVVGSASTKAESV